MFSRLPLLLLAVHSLLGTALGGATIDWTLYHTTEQILQTCQKLAIHQSALASFEEIPDPDSQFRLPVLTISNTTVPEAEKQLILLVAGEHARELITSEIVFWLVSLFLNESAWQPASGWAEIRQVEVTAAKHGWADSSLRAWASSLLQRVTFKIIPVLNIAGRKAVEGGASCLRKTISGVDLNRNWPVAWQKSEAATDEFGGEHPFSEPESRVIKFLTQAFNPHAFVNLHSGEWALYVPWDSKAERGPDLPADTEALLEGMNEYCQCMNGPAGKVAGYLAMGTSMDWMYAEHHVPYPLTFEVYGPKQLGRFSAGGHPRRTLLQNVDNTTEADEVITNQTGLSNRTLQTLNSSLTSHGLAQDTKEPVVTARSQAVTDRSSLCLPMFNPMTVPEYQEVVASWIGSLLVLGRHLHQLPVQTLASFHAEQLQQPELRTDIPRKNTQDLPKPVPNTDDINGGTGLLLGKVQNRFGRKGQSKGKELQHLMQSRKARGRNEDVFGYNIVAASSRILLIVVGVTALLLLVVSRLREGRRRQGTFGKEVME